MQLLFGAETDALVGCGGGKVNAQIPVDPGMAVFWELSCAQQVPGVETQRNH